MFTVYIIKSVNSNKFYIGFTSNLQARLSAHNHTKNKGWTRRFMPWMLLYKETFNTKALAMKREKQLKSAKGRLFIHQLIANQS